MSDDAPPPRPQDAADRLIADASAYMKARAARDADFDRRAADREQERTQPHYPSGQGGR